MNEVKTQANDFLVRLHAPLKLGELHIMWSTDREIISYIKAVSVENPVLRNVVDLRAFFSRLAVFAFRFISSSFFRSACSCALTRWSRCTLLRSERRICPRDSRKTFSLLRWLWDKGWGTCKACSLSLDGRCNGRGSRSVRTLGVVRHRWRNLFADDFKR